MAGPPPNPLQALLGAGKPPQQGEVLPAGPGASDTPLLDALMARGLGQAQQHGELESATPLEGYPQAPNPDPNSPPPLFGEPPGEGYLYARDPIFRQAAMVHTTPDIVRVMLLRAMEVAAQNSLLPFNEEGAMKNADAALKFAQAYLLIDPEVDAEGVPVAAKQALQATGQMAVDAGKPQPAVGGGAAVAGKPGEAHGTVKKGPAVGGHAQPPRVVAGAAAEAIAAMHEHASELLKGARGSRPLPRPRPSS